MEKNSFDQNKFRIIDQPYLQFEQSVHEIDKIRSMGSDVILFSIESLNALAKECRTEKKYGIERKIQNTILALKNINTSKSELNTKLTAIRNQSLIILVSNFERFLNDFTVMLVENYSYLIEWPDKKSSIDLSAFRYGAPSLGEIVLRALREKYTFQDLKSILDFAKQLLGVSVNLKKEKIDKIILIHAKRHVLIHNSGRVDDKFQKQIRDLDGFHFFSNSEIVEITEEEYVEAKELILDLAKEIYEGVKKREDDMPF